MASTAFAASANNINGQQFITGKCLGDLACDEGCCAFKTGLCAGAVVGQESADGGCGFGNAQPNAVAADAFKAGKDTFSAVKAAVQSGQIGPGKLDVSGLTGGATGGSGNATASGAGAGAAAGQQAAGSASGGAASSQAATTGFTNPKAAGNGKGQQFITGKCLSDADCESGCCAFNTGLCAGADFAQDASSGDGGCGFGDAQPNNNAAQAINGKRTMRRGVRSN